MAQKAKPEAVTMEVARMAFECLLEQEQDVFALISAIRGLDPGTDSTLTRLIGIAWNRLGEHGNQYTLADYFGVDATGEQA